MIFCLLSFLSIRFVYNTNLVCAGAYRTYLNAFRKKCHSLQHDNNYLVRSYVQTIRVLFLPVRGRLLDTALDEGLEKDLRAIQKVALISLPLFFASSFVSCKLTPVFRDSFFDAVLPYLPMLFLLPLAYKLIVLLAKLLFYGIPVVIDRFVFSFRSIGTRSIIFRIFIITGVAFLVVSVLQIVKRVV